MARWMQDDLDALCEIVEALCSLTDRVVRSSPILYTEHEQIARSIKERAQTLRNRMLS